MIRRRAPALVLAFSCLTACKVDLGDDGGFGSDPLPDTPITVAPAGGRFTYRPWVELTKETTDERTGWFMVRAPGEDAFHGGMLSIGCTSPFHVRATDDER